MRRCFVETFGTFFLALTVMLSQGMDHAAIAIGLMLMALVVIGGHISGAHYNPAVTLSVWLNNKIDNKEAIAYVACQFIGAFVASLVYQFLTGFLWFAQSLEQASILQSISSEALLTSILCSVIITVTSTSAFNMNHIYPFAIGLTLTAIAYVGHISGGAFNPAIGISPLIYKTILGGSLDIKHILIYSIGPVLGGIIATIYTKFFNNKNLPA